jgi:hypothetical protein
MSEQATTHEISAPEVSQEAEIAIKAKWQDTPTGQWYCNAFRHEAHLPKYATPVYVFGPPRGTAKFSQRELERTGHMGLYLRR